MREASGSFAIVIAIVLLCVGAPLKAREVSAARQIPETVKQTPEIKPSIRRVGGEIKPPTKTRNVAPVYPPIAQSARVEGIVILSATISADGKVVDAAVVRSIPLLDAAALDAVRQWEFEPTRLDGEPIPVIMTVTVQFTLAQQTSGRVVALDQEGRRLGLIPGPADSKAGGTREVYLFDANTRFDPGNGPSYPLADKPLPLKQGTYVTIEWRRSANGSDRMISSITVP